jgi:hypothetical protein
MPDPSVPPTTIIDTEENPNSQPSEPPFQCEPIKLKCHRAHRHTKGCGKSEEALEKFFGREHDDEAKREEDVESDSSDDNDDYPHAHSILNCQYHKHKVAKPQAYGCSPGKSAKITLCHVPHGRHQRSKTIKVSIESLEGHRHMEDYEGPCKGEDQEKR